LQSHSIPPQLETYFERASVAIALAACGEDNPLLRVNDAFEELTGYTAADVVGRNCRMLQRDADNSEARERIRTFLASDTQDTVRTPIVNFHKDGHPFVNLLFMSKLRNQSGHCEFVFASQFDVSRSQPELLAAYDRELARTLLELKPKLADTGIVIEGTLMTIANTAATVAQAKLRLAELDG
jgi:PAS domain S-box-containing protein